MKTTAISQVRDLDSTTRNWLKTLFGREVADEERIIVTLSANGAEPTVEERAEALKGLQELFDRIDPKLRAVDADELEAAIDEACEAVRRGQA